MFEKAMDKIEKEIDGNKGKPYVSLIGNFMKKYLTDHPGDAEEILKDKKSITGSIKEIQAAVKSRAVDGCAAVEDKEVFQLALKYYGIIEEMSEIQKTMNKEDGMQRRKNEAPPVKKKFELSLDELL